MKKLKSVALLSALIFAAAVFAAVPWQDASGTITSGTASQQLAPANPNPQYFLFQNISADTLWIDSGTAAVQDTPSLKILTGGSLELRGEDIPKGVAWFVIGPNTGAKFTCKWR